MTLVQTFPREKGSFLYSNRSFKLLIIWSRLLYINKKLCVYMSKKYLNFFYVAFMTLVLTFPRKKGLFCILKERWLEVSTEVYSVGFELLHIVTTYWKRVKKSIGISFLLPWFYYKLIFEMNGLDWQGCLAGSSKTAPRILIFSIFLVDNRRTQLLLPPTLKVA